VTRRLRLLGHLESPLVAPWKCRRSNRERRFGSHLEEEYWVEREHIRGTTVVLLYLIIENENRFHIGYTPILWLVNDAISVCPHSHVSRLGDRLVLDLGC